MRKLALFVGVALLLAAPAMAQDKPDPRQGGACFGIGLYDDMLPSNGWTKGAGNVYTFSPPAGYGGAVQSMTIDFDDGEWSAEGSGADLSFLTADPTSDVRLEVGDFAASYRAKFLSKGTKFKY